MVVSACQKNCVHSRVFIQNKQPAVQSIWSWTDNRNNQPKIGRIRKIESNLIDEWKWKFDLISLKVITVSECYIIETGWTWDKTRMVPVATATTEQANCRGDEGGRPWKGQQVTSWSLFSSFHRIVLETLFLNFTVPCQSRASHYPLKYHNKLTSNFQFCYLS